jgi:hypothetical protein
MHFAFLLMWERSAGTEAEQRFGPALPRTQMARPNIPPDPVKVSSTRLTAGQISFLHQLSRVGVGSSALPLWKVGMVSPK